VRLLALAIGLALVLPVHGAARDVAQFVANAAVFLLFFLNGLRLPRHEVSAGIGNHRLLWPLVLWCYGAMALAGWLVWQGGQGWMPPLLALGFLYLGCLPSTVQSATAYSSLAGGNVASSVVAAALLNLLGVFITAPLFSALAGSANAGFNPDGLIKVVGILLVPFILGQIAQGWLGGWVKDNRSLVTGMDRPQSPSRSMSPSRARSNSGSGRELMLPAGRGWCLVSLWCYWSGILVPGW